MNPLFEVFKEGNKNGPVLVMLHGWPDDHTIWDALVNQLKANYYCIRVDFPNSGSQITAPHGLTLQEVIAALKETLEAQLPAASLPFTLIGHDWGAIYSYLYAKTFPQQVKSILTIDVGGSIGQQKNPLGYALAPLYQLGLAASFLSLKIPLVGQKLGKIGTMATLVWLQTLTKLSQSPKVSGPKFKKAPSPFQNYPYVDLWKQILSGKKNPQKLPNVPIYYAYGSMGIKKFMQFHDDRWLKNVQKHPLGQVEEFAQSGHWLMHDEPERFAQSVQSFLKKVEATPPSLGV